MHVKPALNAVREKKHKQKQSLRRDGLLMEIS